MVAGAVLVVSAYVLAPFLPDDAYISFRYAENLAEGNGLTFNTRDAPVEGYSNFLWILICAVLHAIGVSLPVAAPVVGGLIGFATLAVLWRAHHGSGAGVGAALLSLLLLATSGPFISYMISGLETPLFTLVMLVAVMAFGRVANTTHLGAHLALAGVGLAAALCRPEGILVYPVLVGLLLARRPAGDGARARKRDASAPARGRRALLVGIAVFAIAYGSYTAWRLAYFGDVVPTSFYAKGGGAGAMALGWWVNLKTYFRSQGYAFPPFGYYYAALAVAAVWGWRRHRGTTERAALSLAAVYGVVYLSFVDWMPGMRYHVPLLALLLIPAVHVLPGAWGHAPADAGAAGAQPAPGAATLGRERRFIAPAAVLLLLSVAFLMMIRLPVRDIEQGNREGLIPLAEWLEGNLPRGSTLAISDVGVVPYYSGFYTIDIHPASLIDRTIAREGLSHAYFFEKDPTVVVVVSRGVFVPKLFPEHFALLKTDEFAARYRFLGTVRYHWVEDRSYWVYVPKDFPPLDDAAFESFPGGIGAMRRLNR